MRSATVVMSAELERAMAELDELFRKLHSAEAPHGSRLLRIYRATNIEQGDPTEVVLRIVGANRIEVHPSPKLLTMIEAMRKELG